ncbi:MAG: AMP-binding protein [Pirellulaceae bacterium]|jgi:acyl-CoA synthetase (AMP-forming)/AMP-acid ligase II/acyl carrier protein|nr:AMP-binding protein [Pirellulaceae bacterium]
MTTVLHPPASRPLASRESTIGCLDGSTRTLVDALERRVQRDAGYCAYRYLNEDGIVSALTIGQLDQRARAIAAWLQGRCSSGDRVLLVYPPGLEFVTAFFGCLYAGVLPVPATYPKPRRPMPRLLAIGIDCRAELALTTAQALEMLQLPTSGEAGRQIEWLATDTVPDDQAGQWRRPVLRPEDLAFLQYTSGSTSEPKGVMVTHGNLVHNLAVIHRAFGLDRIHADGIEPVSVWWLPAYHDMGLIGGILGAVHNEGRLILMSPTSFLKRPLSWLRAMSDYRATVSGAPNFAYSLCVSKTTPEERAALDLSDWRLAFCGAEPIRPETLKRFAEAFESSGFHEEAFYPCYGLAEATLLVTGGDGPQRPRVKRVDRTALAEHRAVEVEDRADQASQTLVGCGAPWLGQEIAIVDVETRRRLPEHQVGEIWVRGPSVAQGYWSRPEDTRLDFQATIEGEDQKTYLRTGDLGFLGDGNLFVTGREKEMIIVRGRNLYPHDIELSMGRSHPALTAGAGASFSVEVDGEERLVVVYEVDRQYRNGDLDDVIRGARRAIVDEHELDPHALVLIRMASMPRTTSGKVQRNLCRQQFLDGSLNVVAQWSNDHPRRGQPSGASTPADLGAESLSPAAPAAFGGQAALAAGSPDGSLRKQLKPPPFSKPDRPLTASEIDRLAERIESFLLDWLIARAGAAGGDADRDRPFAEYGLDSLAAVELSVELEQWLHVQLTPIVAWNYPTPAALARYLAELASGVAASGSPPEAVSPQADEAEFERLLAEVESLSENEAQAALAGQVVEGDETLPRVVVIGEPSESRA